MRAILMLALAWGVVGTANAQTTKSICEDTTIEKNVCLKMSTLRAQLHSLDAQRELMQVNPSYMMAVGARMAVTAREALEMLGPGIPEHRTGLAGVVSQSEELVARAAKGDARMLATANRIRSNCASCHAQEHPPGDIGWDDIFRNDWTYISRHCNEVGKNPYLCKSMNGMLSAYSYNRVSYEAKIQDYAMTREAATEIVRILDDLKAKGFRHLPEKRRSDAAMAAQEVVTLAENQDPLAFEKARNMLTSCTQCHAERRGDEGVGLWSAKARNDLFRTFANK